MKRLNFLVAPMVGALTLGIVACGGDGGNDAGGSDGPTEITYWLWEDDATDPTWENLSEEFNTSQEEVEVTLQTIPLDQYQDRLTTAVSSGSGPDAARSKDWWLGQLAPQGVLAELDPFIEDWDASEDVMEPLWATGQLPGSDETYMLPHQYVTLYLYYRKDYFDEAGLSAPETQEDVVQAAKLITDQNEGRYGIDLRGGAGGQDQWLAWMYAGGARVVDEAGEVVLDDSVAEEANERYLSIATEYDAAPPGTATAAFAQVQTNFSSGTTGMMIHHAGSLDAMREAHGENLGVVPMPTGPSGEASTLGSMSGNVVLSDSDKQEAAWKWISWLSTTDAMETMSTSPQGQLPVLDSVAELEEFTSDEAVQISLEASQTARTWPAIPGVAQLAATTWQTSLQPAMADEKPGADALNEMASLLREE
ncbi:ABC transporter substrate-binding protein [Nesterenkonia haasae]|uniref:ABC transporter substrate-binding protein n=1 Tax=Nesterenkonia haasae TaxID=2587813 RepID=UPI00139142A2|nr:sugar ABC transporter substrate-binding protein [Nesterenkonia haasae]